MIKLNRISDKAIWIDHRKIISMFIEDTVNACTYIHMAHSDGIRVMDTPEEILAKIKEWDDD